MKEDAKKWDQRYAQDFMPHTPSDFLVQMLARLPKGKVLDLACGNGRNAKFLAKQGFFCECVDISKVALESLKDLEGINAICVDLDTYEIAKNTFEVILDFYFLDRRFFPQIKQALKPGGVLLLETFIDDEGFETDIEPRKILQKGELQRVFSDFEIFYDQENVAQRLGNEVKIISFGARKIL